MSVARILVVEDDASLREGLATALRRQDYDVLTAIRGQDALKIVREERVDLMILDLMLPGLDGSYVLEQARREGFTMPVVILSARSSVEERIRGLRAGADDYVPKPFDLQELLTRVAVCLRRVRRPETIKFADILIDLAARSVTKHGVEVHLTPKEFDLLEYFVTHPGKALARGRILEEVWGSDYSGTKRTVDNFVRALRTKLEDDAEQPRYFQTVRARGYLFELRG
jgi:DNA-binding response OmpR family regulator